MIATQGDWIGSPVFGAFTKQAQRPHLRGRLVGVGQRQAEPGQQRRVQRGQVPGRRRRGRSAVLPYGRSACRASAPASNADQSYGIGAMRHAAHKACWSA